MTGAGSSTPNSVECGAHGRDSWVAGGAHIHMAHLTSGAQEAWL